MAAGEGTAAPSALAITIAGRAWPLTADLAALLEVEAEAGAALRLARRSGELALTVRELAAIAVAGAKGHARAAGQAEPTFDIEVACEAIVAEGVSSAMVVAGEFLASACRGGHKAEVRPVTIGAGANPHVTEVGIDIEGVPHVMRMSHDALARIEAQCGPVMVLARRAIAADVTLTELAAIVREGVAAYGRATGNATLQAYSVDGLLEPLFDLGLDRTLAAVSGFLRLAINGGSPPATGEGKAGRA